MNVNNTIYEILCIFNVLSLSEACLSSCKISHPKKKKDKMENQNHFVFFLISFSSIWKKNKHEFFSRYHFIPITLFFFSFYKNRV